MIKITFTRKILLATVAVLGAVALVTGGFARLQNKAFAAVLPSGDVHGYAWSSTIGSV